MSCPDKVNILVVDDLPDKLLSLQAVLEGLDQNIVTAHGGREALRKVLDDDFAVILLDVNMPDMDGFETAALIRRRKKTAHVPIIFVTAYADEMQTAQGYSLGAVDYILSPVVPEVLRTKVGVFVELHRKTLEVRRLAEERIALVREQAARAAAEEATRRSAFLAEASNVLAGSLDHETTLRGFLRLVVPFLGDLSAVTLVDDGGRPVQTELTWVANAEGDVHTVSLRDGPNDLPLADALRQVLETGQSRFLPDLGGGPAPATPAGFPPRSAAIIPLLARGRTLGAILLATGPSGRHYSPADLALAEDLAGRAAVALDNARLYRNIQESDRRKNEFLSMLAHELRNPLAPIRNAVQVLKLKGPTDGDADVGWASAMIDRQVQHIVRMVDDLLDVARITRGKIQLQLRPADLAGVVARAVETSRPLVDERRHQLTVALPPEPVWLRADAARLAQVLTNLLNNAAKYTEEGGRIGLTAAREGEEVVLSVRDSGVGIPPDMLATVFDLFTQGSRSLDRSQGGLGIGLTLVKRLVELHGGTVTAHSAGPGQGSEFVVRLPSLADARPADEPAAAVPIRAGPSPCRILIVEDNVDSAESLAALLRLTGHEVQVAHDGAAALEAAPRFRPQVVLLDIGLPHMDGYETARRLRQLPGQDKVLLVAVTGYGRPEDRRRSKEAGFDHHLVKPIDPLALGQVLPAAERPRLRPSPSLTPVPAW